MQEHAEGPRSAPLQKCHHCGATLTPDASTCPNCGAAQAGTPGGPGKGR